DTTADRAGQSHGNVAYGNTTGFELQTAGEHFANEAHDNTTGFSVGGSFGVVVHDVTSWRNTTGVGISGGTLRDSRVYGNSGDGVGVGSGNVVVLGNTVYDNGTGIHLTMFFVTNTVANNLVCTAGAQLGFWQNTFATLADWRYELGFDTHSLSTDPRFVDVDGADGIRGFQEFGGLRFEGFANRTFTGTATVTAIDRVVSFPSIFGGFRGLPDNNQSLRWSGEVYLSAVGDYSFAINSAGPQRLFVESLSTPLIDDFTTPSNVERSGVFHNATAGRWVSLRYEAVDVGAFPSRAVLQWSTPDNPARRPIWAHETAQAGAAGVAAGQQVLGDQAGPRCR